MINPSPHMKKVDWKAVGIISFIYFIFYLTPMFAVLGPFSTYINSIYSEYRFLGVWLFSGILVSSALGGYISKAKSLREPAIAGFVLLFIFWPLLDRIVVHWYNHRLFIYRTLLPVVPQVIAIFLLSLLGAWLGQRAYKTRKPKKQDNTILTSAP